MSSSKAAESKAHAVEAPVAGAAQAGGDVVGTAPTTSYPAKADQGTTTADFMGAVSQIAQAYKMFVDAGMGGKDAIAAAIEVWRCCHRG